MIEEAKYVMLDTSQYIVLIEKGQVARLNDPRFILTSGFPFITWDHIFELGKTNSLETFLDRLSALETVKTFVTFQTSRSNDLSTITDLLLAEIEYLGQTKAFSHSSLRTFLRSRLGPIQLEIPPEQRENLYRLSQENSSKMGLLSTLQLSEINPRFRSKLRELTSSPNSNSEFWTGRTKVLDDYRQLLKTRTSNLSEQHQFLSHLEHLLAVSGASTASFSEAKSRFFESTRKEESQRMTLSELMNQNVFLELKNRAAAKSRTTCSWITSLDLENTIVNRFLAKIRILQERELENDQRRKIESSNLTDLVFCAYATFVSVYVDKRTLDLVKRNRRGLNIDLHLMRLVDLSVAEVAPRNQGAIQND